MRRVAVALVSACLSLAAVSSHGGAASAPPMAHLVQVDGVGVGMYPTFREDVERYAITTTEETAGAVTVTVTTTDPTGSITINGRPAPDGTRTIDGLQPGDEIAVFVSEFGTTATYSLVYLPAGFPTLRRDTSDANADTPSPGMVMLTLGLWVQPSPFFEAAVDANGVPVYVAAFPNAMDLKRLPNGHYSTARGTGESGAEIIELDDQFRELARFRTVGLSHTDAHDSILLPDGSRYLLAYEPNVSTGMTDSVIQHIGASGAVLFEWNSEDHVDIPAETVVPLNNPDYAHVNSIEVMDDGDLLVSFRHLSAVFKIARTAHDGFDEGEVIWRLGGRVSDFTFVDADGQPDGGPCAQHTATELLNGDIMVFDNGAWNLSPLCIDPANRSGPPVSRVPSRVAVWSLDEATGVGTMERDIQLGSRYAIFAGSAQPLSNGNIMIGWASSTDALASEVDQSGALLWELVAEGSPRYFTYRAFKTDVPDRRAPRVRVAVPAEGAVFMQGAAVEPAVDCIDQGGSSLRTCTTTTLDTSAPGTRSFTVLATDGAGNQTSVQRTYTVLPIVQPTPTPVVVPDPRPDALIRKSGPGAFKGDGVFGTQVGQRVTSVVRRVKGVTSAVVRIQNDGDAPERFIVRKHVTTSTFSVRLRSPDGRRTSPLLAPGESWTVRVRVVRTNKAEPGDQVTTRIVARSISDAARRDAVWFRVRAR